MTELAILASINTECRDTINASDKGFLDRSSPEHDSGMFWSVSLFWLVTCGLCHSNRGDTIDSRSGGFFDSVKRIQGGFKLWLQSGWVGVGDVHFS